MPTPPNYLFLQHAMFQSPQLKIPVSEFFIHSFTHSLAHSHCKCSLRTSSLPGIVLGTEAVGEHKGVPAFALAAFRGAGEADTGQRPHMELLSDHWGWVLREKSGACSLPTLSVSHAPLLWLLIVLWFGASSLTLCPSPSSHPSSHGRPINLPKGQTCSCKHSLQWLHVACQTDRSACAELHVLPSSAAGLAVHVPPLAWGSASAVPNT